MFHTGQWKHPFENELTHKANFHVNSTTKVKVDMLSRKGFYKIYEDRGRHSTVIVLPYKGSTSMMIVLPEEGKMKEVESHLDKNSIRHWQHSVTDRYGS